MVELAESDAVSLADVVEDAVADVAADVEVADVEFVGAADEEPIELREASRASLSSLMRSASAATLLAASSRAARFLSFSLDSASLLRSSVTCSWM